MSSINTERHFSIAGFKEALGGANFEEAILFTRIDKENVQKFNDTAEDMFLTRSIENITCNMLVISGELKVVMDYKKYIVGAHSSFGILPLKVLTEIEASPNFKAYILICSNDFIATSILDKKPISISRLLNVEHSPVHTFDETEYNAVKGSLLRLEQYLYDTTHILRKEIVTNALYNVMLESANIHLKKSKNESIKSKSTIKETYIKRFLEELVKNGDREHNPAFYADKLCISVQYLSLILKEVSGKTANTWIARYLVTRAKVMLRKQENTIQQIAETLNFSDQSSFGKFFKKHVGISPKRYQEENFTL
jgi:AraC-like DNA-binding protein